MNDHQFLILLGAQLLSTAITVEIALRLRWRSIQAMFDRALMHGGSLDTLTGRLEKKLEEVKAIALVSAEVSARVKDMVEGHEERLRDIEEHPVIRRLGGGTK